MSLLENTNIKPIIDYYKTNLADIEKLKSLRIEKRKKFFLTKKKAEIMDDLLIIRTKIALKTNAIKSQKEYLEEICSFDFNFFTQFLTEILSVEGSSYQLLNLSLDTSTSYAKYWVTDFNSESLTMRSKENFCLISPSYILNGTVEFHSQDLTLMDDLNKQAGVILLNTTSSYKAFDYEKEQVSSELIKNNSSLEGIIIDLINLRIANPELSEPQLFVLFTKSFGKIRKKVNKY